MPALHGLIPPQSPITEGASKMPRKDQARKKSTLPISSGSEELKEEEDSVPSFK